jgi:PAS domain S-box-containing protein
MTDVLPNTLIAENAALRSRVDQLEAALHLRDPLNGFSSAITDVLPDAISVADADGRMVYVNPACAALAGLTPADVIGRSIYELFPASLAGNLHAVIRRVADSGQPAVEEGVIHLPVGDVWIQSQLAPLVQANGRCLVAAIARDISGWVAAEEALRQRRAEIDLLYRAGRELGRTLDLTSLYRTLRTFIAELMPCDSLVISSYRAGEPIVCRYFWQEGVEVPVGAFPTIPLEEPGRGTQSIAIHTGESLLLADFQAHRRTATTAYLVEDDGTMVAPDAHPEDDDIARSALIVPLKLEETVTGVLQVLCKRLDAFSPHDLQMLEALAAQLAYAQANATLYARATAEVAARKLAEEEVQRSEARVQAILDNSLDIVALIDPRGGYEYISPTVANVLGYSPDEVRQMPVLALIHPDDAQGIRAAYQALVAAPGESRRVEYRARHQDGSWRWLENKLSNYKDHPLIHAFEYKGRPQ